jgi:hypothetical protein
VNGADSPESALSARAKAIAAGLIRTARAGKHGVFERGIAQARATWWRVLLDLAQRGPDP